MHPKTLAAAEEDKLVEHLCSELTCACALAHPPPTHSAVVANKDNHPAPLVVNFSPTGFLVSLRQAAVDVSSVVGLFARARLESCTRALARGWGPAGPGRYERRSVQELVDDKIYPDLNLPAEDDPGEAQESTRKRNVSSDDDLGGMDTGAKRGRKKRNNGSRPCTTIPAEEPMLGGTITGQGEEQEQEEAHDGSAPSPTQGDENDQADIRQRLDELISKVNDEAKPYQSLLGKLYWFRSQLAKDQADHGGSALQPWHPEVRRTEIGSTSTLAAIMRQEEQVQEEGTPRLSQSDNMETLEELHSKVKSEARPFPAEHYLGKFHLFRSQVAKDDCGSAVGSALSDQPTSSYNDEATVGATELQSHMNVTSAQLEERRLEIGTSATAGGNFFPMHGDGSMSSQPATGNENKASEDVHAVPGSTASLQVMVPEVLPQVPQLSPARARQPVLAGPRREPDNLDGLQNDLGEIQPGRSTSVSAPPYL